MRAMRLGRRASCPVVPCCDLTAPLAEPLRELLFPQLCVVGRLPLVRIIVLLEFCSSSDSAVAARAAEGDVKRLVYEHTFDPLRWRLTPPTRPFYEAKLFGGAR
jgi:hypothetical protein